MGQQPARNARPTTGWPAWPKRRRVQPLRDTQSKAATRAVLHVEMPGIRRRRCRVFLTGCWPSLYHGGHLAVPVFAACHFGHPWALPDIEPVIALVALAYSPSSRWRLHPPRAGVITPVALASPIVMPLVTHCCHRALFTYSCTHSRL